MFGVQICCPKYNTTNASVQFRSVHNDNTAKTHQNQQQISAKIEAYSDNPKDICGISDIRQSRIVGGQTAAHGAYPWLALLGYPKDDGDLSYKCAGTLITYRHVITATHCLNGNM